LDICIFAESLGGTETLVTFPYTQTHGEGLANEETSLDFNSTGDRKVTVDGVAFATAPHLLLNLASNRNSPVHSTKGTPSPINGL
ncbi:hypothetical protein D3C55_14235, partial [Staphylococcus aureus]